MSRKITFNITASAARALDELVEEGDETMTGAMNRAIRLYGYVQRVLRSGGAVQVQETPDGDYRQLVLF